jgi:hypothetical protein
MRLVLRVDLTVVVQLEQDRMVVLDQVVVLLIFVLVHLLLAIVLSLPVAAVVLVDGLAAAAVPVDALQVLTVLLVKVAQD